MRITLFFVLSLILVAQTAAQDKWQQALNLEGKWKFSIGDKAAWSARAYNDVEWESVYVPSPWEDQGFHGYDGYAWYRKSFNGADLKRRDVSYSLFLGYIDDVDEVYFNGRKIGSSGSFPPRYHTAYNAFRSYSIPKEFIDFNGKNVIAVKVMDEGLEGGIVSGDVGIYYNRMDEGIAVNLRGMWDFKVVDTRLFGNRNVNIDETLVTSIGASAIGWVQIMVPGIWENQGFSNYDGGAWYRRKFTIPKELAGEELVIMLGKIDDSDHTYLNGKLIGSTENQHTRVRMYPVSANDYKPGVENVLVVYVDDPQGEGGIYEGPVGLIKQSEFTRYIRWRN